MSAIHDLNNDLMWIFARTLYCAKELKNSGFVPPSSEVTATSEAILRERAKQWIQNDPGAYHVVRSLTSQTMKLFEKYKGAQ